MLLYVAAADIYGAIVAADFTVEHIAALCTTPIFSPRAAFMIWKQCGPKATAIFFFFLSSLFLFSFLGASADEPIFCTYIVVAD